MRSFIYCLYSFLQSSNSERDHNLMIMVLYSSALWRSTLTYRVLESHGLAVLNTECLMCLKEFPRGREMMRLTGCKSGQSSIFTHGLSTGVLVCSVRGILMCTCHVVHFLRWMVTMWHILTFWGSCELSNLETVIYLCHPQECHKNQMSFGQGRGDPFSACCMDPGMSILNIFRDVIRNTCMG